MTFIVRKRPGEAQGQRNGWRSRLTFGHQQQLLAGDWTPLAKFEEAQQALLSAQAQVDAAHVQVGIAQDQLRYTVLLADAPGVVTSTGAEPSLSWINPARQKRGGFWARTSTNRGTFCSQLPPARPLRVQALALGYSEQCQLWLARFSETAVLQADHVRGSHARGLPLDPRFAVARR